MKLFLIAQPRQRVSIELLQTACQQRGVECVVLDPATTNPLEVAIKSGDALYRISDARNYGCLELEYQLLKPGVVSFYRQDDPLLINREEDDSFLLSRLGIPTPPTANYLPQDRQVLRAVVEALGGFPIIIKALGGTHGVGVMRVDSWPSLFSVADFLFAKGGKYALKSFVSATTSARLIVLGDSVVDSIEYQANTDDFRSNEGKVPNVTAKVFSEEVQKTAVAATQALGLEFAGVDIMLPGDQAVVAEVNFPCYFGRCQRLTGTDIAGMMVDFLLAKSQR